MTTSRTEYESALVAELARHGVTDYEVVSGRKHKKLLFTFQGRDIVFAFSSTPSDVRSLRNTLTDLRKLMGVKRVAARKNPARKPKRKASPRPLECPTITVGHDPFAALKALDVSDVPALGEVHAKREPIQPLGPSLWARFCMGIRRLA